MTSIAAYLAVAFLAAANEAALAATVRAAAAAAAAAAAVERMDDVATAPARGRILLGERNRDKWSKLSLK